ncbi:MAG: hypothetical protein KatS3mg124_1758 [Porticoccaceae bacterium]|nr:MAG: hypothetical protein KatS3mg124_1758 [Porticoccaceae bacterium]
MITLTAAARRVLEARYLRRNAAGEIAETPAALFRRVARAVARAEVRYGGEQAAAAWAERFEEAMAALEFLPNSPTLMNAGTRVGQLSACFVLPVEDRMRDIFEALKLMALVQQTGGGTGFAFSRLRPAGDWVASTGGRAAGPLAFMRIFDCATEHIRQGGRRRGANMGVLRVDHPDVAAFVDAKRDRVSFANFNLSVGVTDAFVKAAAAGEPWPLVNPRTGRPTGRADAPALWERIALAAWETGDPGLIFLDAVNRAHPLARPRPHRGHQSLWRGAAFALRILHPGLGESRPPGARPDGGRRRRLGDGSRNGCGSACASSTTCSTWAAGPIAASPGPRAGRARSASG